MGCGVDAVGVFGDGMNHDLVMGELLMVGFVFFVARTERGKYRSLLWIIYKGRRVGGY